jgi:citrate lyase gamma subunit
MAVFRTPIPTVSVNDLLTTRLRAKNTWLTIFKASAAAGIAWLIAGQLSSSDVPILAPVLALGTVRSTLYSTVAQGVQTLVGNIVGVALALLIVDGLGISDALVFSTALISFTIARFLPISNGARDQIPIIVMFVVLFDPGDSSYGISRLVDCVIGSLVGLAVSILVPERPQLDAARRSLERWHLRLVDAVDAIRREVVHPPRERLGDGERHVFMERAGEVLRAAENTVLDDVIAADQSVRFNIRAGAERLAVHELVDDVEQHQRLSLHVQAIALGTDELFDRPGIEPRLPRADLAEMLGLLADMIRRAPVRRDDMSALDERLSARIAATLHDITDGRPDPTTVLESVSLLGRIDQFRDELARSGSAVAEPAPV